MARNRQVNVLFSEEEYAKLQQLADNAGLKLSPYLRKAGLEYIETSTSTSNNLDNEYIDYLQEQINEIYDTISEMNEPINNTEEIDKMKEEIAQMKNNIVTMNEIITTLKQAIEGLNKSNEELKQQIKDFGTLQKDNEKPVHQPEKPSRRNPRVQSIVDEANGVNISEEPEESEPEPTIKPRNTTKQQPEPSNEHYKKLKNIKDGRIAIVIEEGRISTKVNIDGVTKDLKNATIKRLWKEVVDEDTYEEDIEDDSGILDSDFPELTESHIEIINDIYQRLVKGCENRNKYFHILARFASERLDMSEKMINSYLEKHADEYKGLKRAEVF